MLKINRIILIFAASAVITAAPVCATGTDDLYYEHDFANGIKARIFSAQQVLEGHTLRDGSGNLYLSITGRAIYELIEDVGDPAITNPGDGSFHPMRDEHVLDALEGIDLGGVQMDIEVEIYILPYPRRHMMSSSCAGDIIFLSPGVFESTSSVTAYIVTHEVGHAFQGVYLPDTDEEGWDTYLSLRGIASDPVYSSSSPHVNRPKEIFAEDFRFLFGNDDSRYSGTIENPDLPLPVDVPGLEDYLISLVTGRIMYSKEAAAPSIEQITAVNYPNPFNPATTIRVMFGNGESRVGRDLDIRIYGIDGSLVRRLFSGVVTDGEFETEWDGRNDNGARVSSGVYLYRIRSKQESATGKMFLVR